MDACIAEWVVPELGPPEPPDPDLVTIYAGLFPAYRAAREALVPVWEALARHRAEAPEVPTEKIVGAADRARGASR